MLQTEPQIFTRLNTQTINKMLIKSLKTDVRNRKTPSYQIK